MIQSIQAKGAATPIKSHHRYPFFPDLIENQRRSVQYFWEKGLLEEFELFSYIVGKKKNLQLIFHGSQFLLQRPKYTIEEAVRKQKSYSVSLFLPIEFQWLLGNASKSAFISNTSNFSSFDSEDNKGTQKSSSSKLNENKQKRLMEPQRSPDCMPGPNGQPISQIFPVFLGDIPLMTERGSFLINGSARVLVNQIVRCPSVYFKVKIDNKNRRTYIASFLSDYGSWLRFESDYKNRIWVRIDKSQRLSIYALLRALGFPEIFLKYQLKYYSFLLASRESFYTEKPNEAIQYLWKKLTPGRWNSLPGCYSFFYNKFFNPRRYSIGPVGRIRLNKRLNRKDNVIGYPEMKQNSAQIGSEGFRASSKQTSSVALLRGGEVNQTQVKIPTLTPEDILLALDLFIQLHYGEGSLDDIDHLKNRRVRLPGELIQNQFRLALSRIAQVAGDKMTKFEVEGEFRGDLYSSLVEFSAQNGAGNSLQGSSANLSLFHSGVSDSKANFDMVNDSFNRSTLVSNSSNEVLQSKDFPTSSGTRGKAQIGAGKIRNIGKKSHFPVKSFFQAQLFGSSIRELFHTSQLSQYMDQTNPLAEITHKRRLSSLGPGGIGRDQAGFAVREIHPSHFGRICPIETPEGPNAGLVGSLASYCRITENGFLQSPYFAAQKNKHSSQLTSPDHQLSSAWFLFPSEVEDEVFVCSETEVPLKPVKPVQQGMSALNSDEPGPAIGFVGHGLPALNSFSTKATKQAVRYKQEFVTLEKNQIQYFSISPIQMISLATSLIPFLEHDDANRALMGSNMQRQAVPLLFSEKPLVGTGLEIQAARDSSTTLLAKETGQVVFVDSQEIHLATDNLKVYKLQNYWRSNQNTCLRQKPVVQKGEWIEQGDLLADGSATQDGEIALGKNILLAYMPWEGYNFEDAIVISERLVQDDIYTSIHIDRYDIEIRETSYGKEKITRDLPYVNSDQTRNLNSFGIIFPGTWVEEGDILVGKITPISPPKPTPEYRLLLAIFETKPLPYKETSLRVPHGVEGRVLDCIVDYEDELQTDRNGITYDSEIDQRLEFQTSLNKNDWDQLNEQKSDQLINQTDRLIRKSDFTNNLAPIEKVQIFLAHKRKIQLGDKMSGRHGNKGIVSLILPPQDMPFLQDGTSVDIVLNPLGVPSRMNVGQVLECLFGLAAHYLKQNYRLVPFDEMYGQEASRGLVYKKLYEASLRTGYSWLFDPNSPGKSHLFDGRTGEPFHQPILVGYSYMFKLIHLVDEKMHARSTGPYSLVTQQPLGGRSKHGGQRLGEMEVWALEGFGAASILQEFMTVKSDEIYARNTFLFHLMKRRKLPRPGLPESFRVLVHELQALCLSVYYNPDFRLTYPSLIGWDGLFLLSSKKFPTIEQLSSLKNI